MQTSPKIQSTESLLLLLLLLLFDHSHLHHHRCHHHHTTVIISLRFNAINSTVLVQGIQTILGLEADSLAVNGSYLMSTVLCSNGQDAATPLCPRFFPFTLQAAQHKKSE